MSAKLFQLKSFLNYWLDAVDDHSLHSPFLYNFYNIVLRGELSSAEINTLAAVKKKLRQDTRVIQVVDFGAGSVRFKSPKRKISDITAISTTPEKYSRLYARIIGYFKCRHIVELGTSVGLNTLYLAKVHADSRVVTFEGSSELAGVARQLFQENNANNVRIIEGNIDVTLPSYLSASDTVDFALVDANHRFEPTMRYIQCLMQKSHSKTVLALDDIHYSPDMERAWHTIQSHPAVYTTVDLYRCGLIFFDSSLTKQNVVLQF